MQLEPNSPNTSTELFNEDEVAGTPDNRSASDENKYLISRNDPFPAQEVY